MGSSERAGRHRATQGLACIVMLGALGACGGSAGPSGANTATASTPTAEDRATALARTTTPGTTTIAQPANTEGRLLASNCFQCHGTLGLGGFENIRGSEAGEVMDFLTKSAGTDIMAAHAQGYTPEQLKKIVAYLQQ